MGAGAIGLELVAAITEARGPHSVIAALHHTPLPPHLANTTICEFGVDVQDQVSLRQALEKHASKIDTVWNLAAPLSVATAQNPALAHDITVNGMQRLLEAMRSVGLKKICFSDSIGSFGAEAPREDATAAWLCANPEQDPGSDYGRQKRACRELLHEYAEKHGFDTRWAVIPGVLHSKRTWGSGTTEYALDALMAAARKQPYVCPLPLDAKLPMIHVVDLIAGLMALMNAPRASLCEPQHGYTLAGFSFTPAELFSTITETRPDLHFSFSVDLTRNPHAQRFAALWPDTISPTAAARDLSFVAHLDMRATVAAILTAFCEYAAADQA
jgi:threonine 3-dehydrogenase